MDWGDTLSTTATATTSGNVLLIPSGTFSPTAYTFLQAGGGLGGANYLLPNNTTYTAALSVSPTALTLTPTAATALTTAYWYGGQVTGASAAMALSNGTLSNWSTGQPTPPRAWCPVRRPTWSSPPPPALPRRATSCWART